MAESKKKTESVYIPYVRGEGTHQFVGVNGMTYLVKKGEYVEVPVEVAEVLRHSEIEMRNADEYIRQNVSDFAEKLEKM